MPMRTGTEMPELSGAEEWVNGEAEASALRGSPALVHFWAVSCHVCHDNMPTVGEWRDQYADKGLKVIAVHMPRQEDDTDVAAVKADMIAMGMTEPCAIDNEHEIGERFESTIWPGYFLFDAEGKLRGRAGGYAGLKIIEAPLKRLLDPVLE